MAEIFSNKWIYTVSPETETYDAARNLPATWKDPATGISHSSMKLYSDEKLNSMGWYKVMINENNNVQSRYEEKIIDSFIYRPNSSDYILSFKIQYKPLEDIRFIKISDLTSERDQNTIERLNHKTEEEHKQILYRSISLLVKAFSQGTAADIASFVNNNSFLQGLLNQTTTLNSETIAYDNRISQAKTENDIQTLINL